MDRGRTRSTSSLMRSVRIPPVNVAPKNRANVACCGDGCREGRPNAGLRHSGQASVPSSAATRPRRITTLTVWPINSESVTSRWISPAIFTSTLGIAAGQAPSLHQAATGTSTARAAIPRNTSPAAPPSSGPTEAGRSAPGTIDSAEVAARGAPVRRGWGRRFMPRIVPKAVRTVYPDRVGRAALLEEL